MTTWDSHVTVRAGPLGSFTPRRDGTHAPNGKPPGLRPSDARAQLNQRPTSPVDEVWTDEISDSLLYGARTDAPAAVLPSTNLLEPLQAGRHGLKHRIGSVDPPPALA